MNMKLVSIAVMAMLVGVIAVMGYQLYGTPKITGYAASADSGPYQGYSSYEEMMQAHHGGEVQQDSGCGMDSGPSASKFATGEVTDYGISLDNKGYQDLLGYADLRLDGVQSEKIIGFDIEIPCCGFQKIQANGNCECGHHVALVGLAKLLASKGYDKDEIQKEIDVWKNIFYPNGVDSGAGACG